MIVSLEGSPLAFKMLRHNTQTFPSITPWNAMLWPPPPPALPAQSSHRTGPAKPPRAPVCILPPSNTHKESCLLLLFVG